MNQMVRLLNYTNSFKSCQFKILATTSSNLFFLACLSSSKTDVVLSQTKPRKFTSTPLLGFFCGAATQHGSWSSHS